MLTNLRDAFGDQCSIVTLSLKRTVFEIFDF